MTDNVVKSTDINTKSTEKKSATKKTATPKVAKEKGERNADVAVPQSGYKFIYFESGSSYVTAEGYRFSREQRIHQVPVEEADRLLKLDNFRLPDQVELEELAKEI
jgi:hypothetical protein